MPRRLALTLLLVSPGCASYGFNYLDPKRPRCAEALGASHPSLSVPETLEIVSFNIKFGQEPEKAMRTLARNALDDADIFLLQEMDLPSTRTIARSLELNYVFYPIAVHPQSGRQFGLSILSPWPVRDDRKVPLPRIDSSDDIRKAAVSATVWVQGIPVGVVNTHLQSGLSPVEIGDQLQIVLGCVFGEVCAQTGAPFLSERPYAVLAGDLNTTSSAHLEVADEILGWEGMARVPGIERTMKYLFGAGRLDHIFASPELEVVASGHGAGFFGTGSDHRPIWAELRFLGTPPVPWQGLESDWGNRVEYRETLRVVRRAFESRLDIKRPRVTCETRKRRAEHVLAARAIRMHIPAAPRLERSAREEETSTCRLLAVR